MVSTSSRLDRRFLVAVTVVALLLVLAVAAGRPQAAAAGGPGVWTDISGSLGPARRSLIQPDAARGSGRRAPRRLGDERLERAACCTVRSPPTAAWPASAGR